ncbi:MAG: ATP-binding cassette domain-containing protein, partial [Candidatus Binatia bacterium]|nr:ATP-binding cassette domain-containing protein [Candidatus Binatia bacterium]
MNTPHGHTPRQPAIVVSDVWFAYPGAPSALKGVSLTVDAGTICMLLGPSGSGKSTLLKLIKGLLRPQRGWVSIFGVDVSHGWSRPRKRTV